MNKGKCLYYQLECIAPWKCANQIDAEGVICKKGGIIESKMMYLDKLDKRENEYKHKFKISYLGI